MSTNMKLLYLLGLFISIIIGGLTVFYGIQEPKVSDVSIENVVLQGRLILNQPPELIGITVSEFKSNGTGPLENGIAETSDLIVYFISLPVDIDGDKIADIFVYDHTQNPTYVQSLYEDYKNGLELTIEYEKLSLDVISKSLSFIHKVAEKNNVYRLTYVYDVY